MTDLYNSVFSLLKTALFNEDLIMPENSPWSEIITELDEQCVSALLTNKIELLNLTDSEQENLNLSVMRSIAFWHSNMHEQQEVLGLLQREGIPAVVLKGSAAAVYYPKPEYRSMGDIDLIVRPEAFDKACTVLEQAGYIHLDHKHERHDSFLMNGILIELHRCFAGLNDKAQSHYLDNLIYEGINHAEIKRIDDYGFSVLPRLENGLVLLEHISRHLERGLGLRQIIDWMLYVNSELDDEFWEDSFCNAVEQIGLKKLAIVATRMCQMYLGLKDEITWCSQADEELCRDLMMFVMEHGNFGRRIDASSKTVSVLFYFRSPIALFRVLQRTGCKTWKALERHPWLKPFAWIYQIFRWGHRGLQRSDAINGVIRDFSRAKVEDAFFDRLEVTRRSKM